MHERLLWIMVVSQILLAGGILLIVPLVTRRGLLFGVYVGEEVWDSDEARRITRGWYIGMGLALAVSLLAATVLVTLMPRSPLAMFSIFILLLGQLVCYLRAYFQAKALVTSRPIPVAEAPLLADTPSTLILPVVALGFSLAVGLFAIAHAWSAYPELPPRVPTHFGPSGRPDAWAVKSFSSVMALPVGTLAMGVLLSATAVLAARAKRAVRQRDGGVSLEAQLRFRQATARLLSAVAILTTAMMATISYYAVRTAAGEATGMPPWMMVYLVALLGCAVGGTLYIAIRYGQGGARWERRTATAPLTDGLADNERWILGAFYVNRDDPSIFVEKRFGIGYTINLGNPKAVLLLVGFFLLIAIFIVMALTTTRV